MSANNGSRGKAEIERISFRPAKGGIISRTEKKIKRGGQGGGPMHDYESEEVVHPTADHAAKHLKGMLGHCFKGECETKGEE